MRLAITPMVLTFCPGALGIIKQRHARVDQRRPFALHPGLSRVQNIIQRSSQHPNVGLSVNASMASRDLVHFHTVCGKAAPTIERVVISPRHALGASNERDAARVNLRHILPYRFKNGRLRLFLASSSEERPVYARPLPESCSLDSREDR